MEYLHILKKYLDEDIGKAGAQIKSENIALILGNGCTRLALNNSPSWDKWIKTLWENIDPKIPFEYMQLRDVTLPESIQYLINYTDSIGDPTDRKEKQKYIYKSLWATTEQIEIDDVKSSFHEMCITSFNTIFTTNYDTLIERICLKNNISVHLYPIGYHERGVEREGVTLTPNLHKKPKSEIKLIKLHGTFPFDHLNANYSNSPQDFLFNTWWDNGHYKDIVAGVREYSKMYPSTRDIIDDLRSNDPDIKSIEGLIFLGYGMKSEDDIVIQLLSRLGHQMRHSMTYGGDEVDELRYSGNWGIPHLSIPASYGDEKVNRYDAHCHFINLFANRNIPNLRCDEVNHRCILIGQASFANVIRIDEPPAQERSYRIVQEKDSQGKKVEYNTSYVAGQVLSPTLLLDAWGLKSLFVSAIGYDKPGLEIKNRLAKTENINYRYLIKDKIRKTDNSFVVTHSEFRTIYDTTQEFNESNKLIEENLGKVEELITTNEIIPSLIYISKWYRGEMLKTGFLHFVCNHAANPLVCYETGSGGSHSDINSDIPYEDSKEEGIGEYCDVMLASSLYIMRAFRWPLFDIKMKSSSPVYEFDLSTSLDEWGKKYNSENFQRFDYRHRASQNSNFILGLSNLWNKGLLSRIFNDVRSKFYYKNISWWIVTIGDMGMVAISKHHNKGWWIDTLEIEKSLVKNAFGCGDISRGAFVGYYLKNVHVNNAEHLNYDKNEFLKNHNEVLNAVKCAVYVGTQKLTYFELDDALFNLSWDNVQNESEKLLVKELNQETFTEMKKRIGVDT